MGNKKGLLKSILPWLIVLMVISVAIPFFNQSESSEIRYDKFIEIVQKEKVKDVEIVPKSLVIDVSGTYSKKASNGKKEDTKFSVVIPRTETELDSLISLLDENGTKINVVNDAERNQLLNFIVSLLPYLILFGGMFFFLKMMSNTAGGNNKAFEFGNSRAKLEKNSKTHFSDVAGMDEEKEEVKELVDFLKTPKKFADMGAKIPRGVLLVGPPGTGKTLLARAVAGEANVPFYSISGSEFVEMFVGVGAGRVRDMFKKAKQTAPCIIFIDEIDAVGRQRGAGMGGGNDEREQTLNQLLSEMDGFDSTKGLLVLGATNRPEILDPALLRPGRFDRRVVVDKPDLNGRINILKVHSKDVLLDDTVDFKEIALATSGAVGADLANMMNEAAITAVKHGRSAVSQKDLFEAVEVVLVGKEKKDRIMSKEERRIVSYHEVGHALVSALQKHSEPVQKITIVPRTMGALGYVMNVPEEEKYLNTKKELEARLVELMGGRAAEEIVFDTVTTGAANDIQQATNLARAMVTQYGMSKKFGLMGLESQENQYLTGRTILNCGDATAAEIDQEVMKILKEAYDEAKRLLQDDRDAMDQIAAFLIEKETITGKEFMEIFRRVKGLPDPEGQKELSQSEEQEELPKPAEPEEFSQPEKPEDKEKGAGDREDSNGQQSVPEPESSPEAQEPVTWTQPGNGSSM